MWLPFGGSVESQIGGALPIEQASQAARLRLWKKISIKVLIRPPNLPHMDDIAEVSHSLGSGQSEPLAG
jgi:hypothetical protein